MNIKLKIIIAVLIVAALILLINMIRRKKLELKYALIWIILGIGILLLDVIPGFMEWMAALLGIASPVNMLFFLGFCFSLLIIFSISMYLSDMSVKLKSLAQEAALREAYLEERIRKLEDKTSVKPQKIDAQDTKTSSQEI